MIARFGAMKLDQKTFMGLWPVIVASVAIAITWGSMQSQAGQTRDDIASFKVQIEEIKTHRFADNSRMVRMETLLEQILNEIKKGN